MSNGKAILQINRMFSPWQDAGIRYKVIIDGSIVMAIANGKSQDIELSTGRHGVRVRTFWMGSHAIIVNLKQGHATNLICEINGNGFRTLLRALFQPKHYLNLYVDSHH
jgi:hypothetical protein